MDLNEIILLSVALALDAMLVSFSYGLIICTQRVRSSLVLALFFGLFQFLMPIFGWFFTSIVYNYLVLYSKYIVSIIFLFLGLKFLKEALEKETQNKNDCISIFCIIGLAFATSIDALGAGISLRLLNADIFKSSIIIGIITFILSVIGFFSGNIFCNFDKKYLQTLGAIFLIYLSVKSLF